MEYTQWGFGKLIMQIVEVLILVVMEYTQWEPGLRSLISKGQRLNPCCNGIYSMSVVLELLGVATPGLNPCCNGIYSMSRNEGSFVTEFKS